MSGIDRRRVLALLHELADEGEQRRLWLSTGPPEVSSFVEALCGLYDDTGLGQALERRGETPVFGAEIDRSLIELHEVTTWVDQRSAPEELLAHPSMKVVRSLAARAHRLLSDQHPP